jgi:hypothetical protein
VVRSGRVPAARRAVTFGSVRPAVRTLPRLHRRGSACLLALASGLVLSGCGGGGESSEEEPAATSSAAPSSAQEAHESELAAGLLPAEAFGEDATVVPLTEEQLRQGAGLTAQLKDVKITPPECLTAVQGTQPDVESFDDIAAQSATVGSTTTVEVLASGGATGASLDAMAQAVTRCPQAEISSPAFGTATITFESVPVDDLGDGSAALRFTTVVAQPDGSRVSVPALVGAVRDGERLVTLVSLSQSGAAPDPAAFTQLLQQAYEAQAEALD